MPVTFVGHPMAQHAATAASRRARARAAAARARAAGVRAAAGQPRVGARHARATCCSTPRCCCVRRVPTRASSCRSSTRPTRDRFEAAIYRRGLADLPLTMLYGHASDALRAADVGIVASGTATLEAALARQIFAVAGEEYNRSSDFFNKNIRDYEYETIVAMALEALNYENIVLVNAPFTKEIRSIDYINGLKSKLKKINASLVVVWVETSKEVCRQRMIARNSDRDSWKLAHWDEYIAGCNFDIPEALDDPNVKDDLLIFKNSSDAEFKTSLNQTVAILEESQGANI